MIPLALCGLFRNHAIRRERAKCCPAELAWTRHLTFPQELPILRPMASQTQSSKFNSGDIIQHKRFGYRGVIISVDPSFSGSEDWYQREARVPSQPPKDRPWYHVLVHGTETESYVSERNLEFDPIGDEVEHPLVDVIFDELRDGKYVRARVMN